MLWNCARAKSVEFTFSVQNEIIIVFQMVDLPVRSTTSMSLFRVFRRLPLKQLSKNCPSFDRVIDQLPNLFVKAGTQVKEIPRYMYL
jgi:hypothetical protein